MTVTALTHDTVASRTGVGLVLAVASATSFGLSGVLARGLLDMQPGTAQRVAVPPGHARDELGRLAASVNALLQANDDALERERCLRAEV